MKLRKTENHFLIKRYLSKCIIYGRNAFAGLTFMVSFLIISLRVYASEDETRMVEEMENMDAFPHKRLLCFGLVFLIVAYILLAAFLTRKKKNNKK